MDARTPGHLLIALLIGVIATIATSWAAAVCVDARNGCRAPTSVLRNVDNGWVFSGRMWRSSGSTWFTGEWFIPGSGEKADPLFGMWHENEAFSATTYDIECAPELRQQNVRIVRSTVATGWPCRAFWGQVDCAVSGDELVRTWVLLGSESAVRTSLPPWPGGPAYYALLRVIPVRPLWAGLLADVSWFGATALMLLVGTRAVVARIRRRRGRCVDCGHPQFAGGRCPECGSKYEIARSVPAVRSGPIERTA